MSMINIHIQSQLYVPVGMGKNKPNIVKLMGIPSVTWTPENKGFFYPADETHKLYYHYVDKPQEEDILVVEFTKHPEWTM